MSANLKRIVAVGILAGCVLMLFTISRDHQTTEYVPSKPDGQNVPDASPGLHSPIPSVQPTPNEVQGAGTQDSDTAADSGKKPITNYSVQKPVLMGLALGDSDEKVLQLHGEPVYRYMMDDGISPISVYDYEEFSVGFNVNRQLEYIDVSSPDAEPGLNGLKLGQHEENAVQALGKPDTNTGYVLSYQTKFTVLKLDVDPKTKIIQSIKLFARAISS